MSSVCSSLRRLSKSAYRDFSSLSENQQAFSVCALAVAAIHAPLTTAACLAIGAGSYAYCTLRQPMPPPPYSLMTTDDLETVGLSPKEQRQIGDYINEKRSSWEKLPAQGIRLPKEVTGLPRTLRVFRDGRGDLRAMVLCNRKRTVDGKVTKTLPRIGEGAFNKISQAVDFLTNTLWIRRRGPLSTYAALPNPLDHLSNCLAHHRSVEAEPTIAPAPVGFHLYLSKKGQMVETFQPRWLDSLQHHDLSSASKEQFLTLIRQLLESLVVLKKHRLSHNDTHIENYLVFKNRDGSLRIGLNDFDLAHRNATTRWSDYYKTREAVTTLLSCGAPSLDAPFIKQMRALLIRLDQMEDPVERLAAFDKEFSRKDSKTLNV